MHQSVNQLSDDVLKLLIDRLSRQGVFDPRFSPASPPPAPSGPAFKNTTEVPYKPTMYMSEQLWSRIGGSRCCVYQQVTCESTPMRAKLPTSLRRQNGLLKSVSERLEALISNILSNYFRGLQLTRHVKGRIEVPGPIRGTLLRFLVFETPWDICAHCSYVFEFLVDEPVDGLPVIIWKVAGDEWHKGSTRVKFLSEDGSEHEARKKFDPMVFHLI